MSTQVQETGSSTGLVCADRPYSALNLFPPINSPFRFGPARTLRLAPTQQTPKKKYDDSPRSPKASHHVPCHLNRAQRTGRPDLCGGQQTLNGSAANVASTELGCRRCRRRRCPLLGNPILMR